MIAVLIAVCGLVGISNAFPLARRMVDMSYVLDETAHGHPVMKRFKIDELFNGTSDVLGGVWIQMEEYSSAIHVGTHMDAPSHFIKGGLTIDQIPLEKFVAPAAVIDITAKAELDPDAEATVEDLLHWESTTGQSLDGTIIMLRSGWGRKWNNMTAYYGTPDDDIHHLHFPGLAAEASQWLVDNRNINGVGTDALSIDKGPSTGFPTHLNILGHGLFAIENVANMEALPIYGAKLYVFPIKIGKGSGSPVRVVATIPEVMYSS